MPMSTCSSHSSHQCEMGTYVHGMTATAVQVKKQAGSWQADASVPKRGVVGGFLCHHRRDNVDIQINPNRPQSGRPRRGLCIFISRRAISGFPACNCTIAQISDSSRHTRTGVLLLPLVLSPESLCAGPFITQPPRYVRIHASSSSARDYSY